MGRQKDRILWNVLLGTSAYLIDSMRGRLNDNLKDVRDRAGDFYETASNRVSKATDVIRGEEDTHYFSHTAAVLIGVGIGVGVGLLLAPASGEETRGNLADKVHDFKSKMRSRSSEPAAATGTYGE